MKQILISLAALAMIFACQKFPEAEVQPAEPETTIVTFLLEDNGLSRATSDSNESTIETAQVAVYDSNGQLLSIGDASDGAAVLRVPLGATGCSAIALANSTIDLGITSSWTVAHMQTSTLGENRSLSLTGLEMSGFMGNITFTENYTGTVRMGRIAAKVEIDEIVNALPGNDVLQINGIYLINVSKSARCDCVVENVTWAQKRGYVASETTITPYTADIFNELVYPGDTYDTPHYFYCYPNPTTTDSSAETWSPRFTRLVVEATVGTGHYYYPINIKGATSGLMNNTLYKITRLTITGPGSDSPDKPISKGGASFTFQVADWNSGISQEVEI